MKYAVPFAFALLVICTAIASAAAPTLTSLYPLGGQRGTTFSVTLSGAKGDTPAKGVWIDSPGVLFAMGDKRSAQVTIAPDAPLGFHLVRAFNDDGASDLKWFSIGALPEISETEPNDELGKEQPINKLPVCINAKLGKRGDTDLYSVQLTAGQTLVASVESYSLGIGLDAMLQLRDTSNSIIVTAHDGRNLDPQLLFTAKTAGRYSLQMAGIPYPPTADVGYFGGEEIIYRLLLSTAPAVLRVFPAAISRKGKTKLDFLGANIPAKAASLEAEAGKLPPWPLVQTYTSPDALRPMQVAITDLPVQREAEPNNSAEKAQALALPSCVAGRIDKADDLDRYRFSIKKGEYRNISLLAKQLGSPLTARLAIVDATGAEITTANGSGEAADPLLSWKATADGDYQLVVSDLYRHGGSDTEYVLFFEPGLETFSAVITSPKTAFTLNAGETTEVKVKATRVNGYKGALVARVSGLPAGVSAAEVIVPEKTGAEFSITLTAAIDAMPSNAAFEVSVWTQPPAPVPPAVKDAKAVTKTETKVAAPPTLQHRLATFPLRTPETQRGNSPLDTASWLWLTVLPTKK